MRTTNSGAAVAVTAFLTANSHAVSATLLSGAASGGGPLHQGDACMDAGVPFTGSNPINTVGDNTIQNPDLHGLGGNRNIHITVEPATASLAVGPGGGGGSGNVPLPAAARLSGPGQPAAVGIAGRGKLSV